LDPAEAPIAPAARSAPTRPLRSLERHDELVVASIYEREIGASLERVWENVHDWEHLPWLHPQAFGSIEKLDAGDWGWHARIGIGQDAAAQIELELVADVDAGRYVSRTLVGPGAPSEIWTHLDPVASDRTAIRVEFCVMPLPKEALQRVGEGYLSLNALLWDQDEGMMQTRETALRACRTDRGVAAGSTPDAQPEVRLALGSLEAVLARLPLAVCFGGERFRIVEVEGEIVAHGVRCPHLFGPLDETTIVEGRIECPWHGYRFDVRTGRSCDGRGLRLTKAPRVVIDAATGAVELHSRDASA
jgi:nitrite reductase/ring-hydroxylating ferredoxin subunit